MTRNNDPLTRAQNSAHEWLAAVGTALGTDDRRYTYRVLRAWLHTLRDRLTVESSVHFAAQLPELLRGTYYDGWVPSRVPQRYRSEECVDRIASEATIRRTDVRKALGGVSAGMRGLLSEGALDHVLDQLPRDLRELFVGAESSEPTDAGRAARAPVSADSGTGAAAGQPGLPERLSELQRQVDSLTTVVTSLTRDLRDHPAPERFSQPSIEQDPEAITAANEVLLPRGS